MWGYQIPRYPGQEPISFQPSCPSRALQWASCTFSRKGPGTGSWDDSTNTLNFNPRKLSRVSIHSEKVGALGKPGVRLLELAVITEFLDSHRQSHT